MNYVYSSTNVKQFAVPLLAIGAKWLGGLAVGAVMDMLAGKALEAAKAKLASDVTKKVESGEIDVKKNKKEADAYRRKHGSSTIVSANTLRAGSKIKHELLGAVFLIISVNSRNRDGSANITYKLVNQKDIGVLSTEEPQSITLDAESLSQFYRLVG